jgi:hypothetical protein
VFALYSGGEQILCCALFCFSCQRERAWIPINQLNPATGCACLKPGPEFSKSYFMVFSMLNDLMCEVVLLVLLILVEINVREYRRDNQKETNSCKLNTCIKYS